MCPSCGSYRYEQDMVGDEMTLRCLDCGWGWTLERYHDEGEDKWRDPREGDER